VVEVLSSPSLKGDVIARLERQHANVLSFLENGTGGGDIGVQDCCDVIYSLFLLGEGGRLAAAAPDAFCDALAKVDFPGWKATGKDRLTVHNVAYAFGALNLLRTITGRDLYGRVLQGREPAFDQLIDGKTGLPLYPRWLAHHNWRVSHWLGGIPSIFLSLSMADLPDRAAHRARAEALIERTNRSLDPKTGLIRLYKVKLLQSAFRLFYGVRHDPDLGDVGGVAHVTWVNHAMGIAYVANDALCKTAGDLFLAHSPYMESVPYCLDFDIVQIVRTAMKRNSDAARKYEARAREMMSSIEDFFSGEVPEGYTLHKLPGALATYHECLLLAGGTGALGSGMKAIDIITAANWL